MDTLLQQYLTSLKSSVNEMAGLVEESIAITTKSLAKKSDEQLDLIRQFEDRINEFDKKIDHDCFKLLARQSPVARDLRLIIACTKMGADLERMGDLSLTISYCVADYLKAQPVAEVSEVPKMSDLVRLMVRTGLEAFMKGDEALARKVLEMDNQVDQYRDQISTNIREAMKKDNSNVDGQLEVFTIVRNLERIGDHATNIAEEAIFMISGKDVRYGNHDTEEKQGGVYEQ